VVAPWSSIIWLPVMVREASAASHTTAAEMSTGLTIAFSSDPSESR
jgi:hypothetical protein